MIVWLGGRIRGRPHGSLPPVDEPQPAVSGGVCIAVRAGTASLWIPTVGNQRVSACVDIAATGNGSVMVYALFSIYDTASYGQ